MWNAVSIYQFYIELAASVGPQCTEHLKNKSPVIDICGIEEKYCDWKPVGSPLHMCSSGMDNNGTSLIEGICCYGRLWIKDRFKRGLNLIATLHGLHERNTTSRVADCMDEQK